MPEIKRSFTSGKMNKDLDERLIPPGEYRDAQNIQVATSEGSDVGTVQNILGNTPGCSYTYPGDNPVPEGSTTVGSISDEKNDTLYWLVAGTNFEDVVVLNFPLAPASVMSFKDLIMRTGAGGAGCEPVFVDKYKFCTGIQPSLAGVQNSISLDDTSLYDHVFIGMTATGFVGTSLTWQANVVDVGEINILPVTYTSHFNQVSVLPPPINTENLRVRGLINTGCFGGPTQFAFTETRAGYAYGSSYASAGCCPNYGETTGVLSNLPDCDASTNRGDSQFWMLPVDYDQSIVVGSIISDVVDINTQMCPMNAMCGVQAEILDIQYQQLCADSENITSPGFSTMPSPFFQMHTCFNAYVFTIGYNGQSRWLERSLLSYTIGNPYNCTGTTAQGGGGCNGEAYTWNPLEATISPPSYLQNVPNNTISIYSSQWLDEIYNTLYDANGVLTGAQLMIDNNLGAGIYWPPNSCIDPTTVSGPLDNTFDIVDCTTGGAQNALGFNTNGRPLHFTTPPGSGVQAVFLDASVNLNAVDTVCFEKDRILNFDPSRLITGINIIDDMLLWTDNFSEPKKINIPRSIQGTDPAGDTHTAVVNDDQGISPPSSYQPTYEEHITVIRKNPKNALTVEMNTGRDDSLNYSGVTNTVIDPAISGLTSSIILSDNPAVVNDFSALAIGDTVRIIIETNVSGNSNFEVAWAVGEYLLLREFSGGVSDPIPLANWTIRGLIKEWVLNNYDSSNGDVQVEIEIMAVKGTPPSPDPTTPTVPLSYTVDIENQETVIFEDKFPRFSYRYKYADGEYSTFAPWTEVAFSPGNFDYEPHKGWNTGMINNIVSVKLKNFVPNIDDAAVLWNQPLGQDIVSIDILYKEEISPNIYIVETVSPVDINVSGNPLPWYVNEYEITSETIKSTVASNQLLRPWDNVPKKALAQDTTGNRIVYANYEQGYDLKVAGRNYRPSFTNYLTNWGGIVSGAAEKSIKSLRDYKLGVVFTDEYGRETPILIGESGGFTVEKKDSERYNRLVAKLDGDTPNEVAYFKFYIKETSSEYYNLAMDRWYEAEDGNIWLAFPSSDRNKVDLDTSLYFKKGDDETVLENTTRYKILAIENEAPEFIKTRSVRIGSAIHNQGTVINIPNSLGFKYLFGNPAEELAEAPAIGNATFNINYVEGMFGGNSMSHMDEIKEELYIEFVRSGDRSQKYLVAEITANRKDDTGADQQPTNYFITLDKAIENDAAFIYDDAASPSRIEPDTKVQFYKAIIQNSPKYEGRFFAKIENDGKIKAQITDDSLNINYFEKASQRIYVLDHDDELKERSEYCAYESNNGNMVMKNWSGFAVPENPGGQEFNYYYARQSYFGEWADWYPPVLNIPLSHPLKMIIANQVRGDGEAGVWFVDRSTKKYDKNSSGENLWWSNTNDMSSGWAPNCVNAWGCGYTGVSGRVGGGIITDVYTGSSRFNLAFGGFGEYAWANLHFHAHGSITSYHINTSSMSLANFWDIGGANPYYNDASTVNFVERLTPGMYFKWREDPTETVYQIDGTINYGRELRFGRHEGRLNLGPGDPDFKNRTLMGADSAYHKAYGFNVFPNMKFWDPAGGDGGGLGTYMINGLNLGSGEKDISGNFHEITTSGTNNSTTLQFASGTDFSNIQPGMTIIDTNYYSGGEIFTEVVSIDPSLNQVVMSDPPTSSISTGTDLKFGHAIRVVSEHVFPVTSTDITDNYIIVNNKSVTCNLNSLKPTYSLQKGMMLDAYNLDAAGGVQNPLNMNVIIKDIVPDGANWKVILTGYYNTYGYKNNSQDDEFSPGTAWTVGSRIRFRQVAMNGASNFTERNAEIFQGNFGNSHGGIGAVGYDMVFVEPVEEYSDGGFLPQNPFVWETEPKDDTGLDIYYEISENNPKMLTKNTINTAIPIGSAVDSTDGGFDTSSIEVTVVNNTSDTGDIIRLSNNMWMGPGTTTDPNTGQIIYPLMQYSMLEITKPNGVKFEIQVTEVIPHPTTPNATRELRLNSNLTNSKYFLNWHNCYSFGNGVESNRIKDGFNLPFITSGVKVSTTSDEEYKKERRKYGLIYSGIYNSTSGVNNLNQFIQAEKITKDINPIYGSIQKLHSGWGQSGDLLALCEDRVLKILANKDALFNADGNTNVTATNRVLGTATPYSGEFGISKNPESFAHEGYRAYFTDKVRGTVMRLSMDGLTPISDAGMKDWFRDNLRFTLPNDTLIGSYDDKKRQYNITNRNITATYREDVKGWTSFKSFIPENGISCANEYYTFNMGQLWRHHDESVDRNTFYGIFYPSSINVIMNDTPGSIKTFHTLNYEGSQSKIDAIQSSAGVPDNYDTWDHTTWDGTFDGNGIPNYGVVTSTVSDNDYYNLTPGGTTGWFVDNIETDKEVGTLNEFIEKEGKWFNYIKGKAWQ